MVTLNAMQDMMGGFFAPELPRHANFPYPEGECCVWTESGRAALECLLWNMPTPPRRAWVPRMACNTLCEPLLRCGIPLHRYGCDEQFRPRLPEKAGQEDLLILINYFGVMEEMVANAAARFPGMVIVDATMALYSPPPPGVPAFYSPRKFSGVPDGGVALAPFALTKQPAELSASAARALFMLERLEHGAGAALPASLEAEAGLSRPARRISPLTRQLLHSIDYAAAAQRRLENYAMLHRHLAGLNRLRLPLHPTHAPMCYPLVSGIPELRDALVEAGVALPLFWPEVVETTDASAPENKLARTLLPLPLDQRYTAADMEHLAALILRG